jgi:hypothetical protein
MEFDYKLSLIKNLLSNLPPLREACREHEIETVKTFVSRFSPAPKPAAASEPRYRERASGSFSVDSENSAVKAAFEEIRERIGQNRKR